MATTQQRKKKKPPGVYNLAGVFMLVAGMTSLASSLTVLLILLVVGVGLIWLFPFAVAIWEVGMGFQVLAGIRKPEAPYYAAFGGFMALFSCNILGVVLELLAFIMMMSPKVQDYLDGDEYEYVDV